MKTHITTSGISSLECNFISTLLPDDVILSSSMTSNTSAVFTYRINYTPKIIFALNNNIEIIHISNLYGEPRKKLRPYESVLFSMDGEYKEIKNFLELNGAVQKELVKDTSFHVISGEMEKNKQEFTEMYEIPVIQKEQVFDNNYEILRKNVLLFSYKKRTTCLKDRNTNTETKNEICIDNDIKQNNNRNNGFSTEDDLIEEIGSDSRGNVSEENEKKNPSDVNQRVEPENSEIESIGNIEPKNIFNGQTFVIKIKSPELFNFIKRLIIEHGGIRLSDAIDGAITLTDCTENFTKKMIDESEIGHVVYYQYVFDCVENQLLLCLDSYRVYLNEIKYPLLNRRIRINGKDRRLENKVKALGGIIKNDADVDYVVVDKKLSTRKMHTSDLKIKEALERNMNKEKDTNVSKECSQTFETKNQHVENNEVTRENLWNSSRGKNREFSEMEEYLKKRIEPKKKLYRDTKLINNSLLSDKSPIRSYSIKTGIRKYHPTSSQSSKSSVVLPYKIVDINWIETCLLTLKIPPSRLPSFDFSPTVTASAPVLFQYSGIPPSLIPTISEKIKSRGDHLLHSEHLERTCTGLIIGRIAITSKVLCALVKGIDIIKAENFINNDFTPIGEKDVTPQNKRLIKAILHWKNKKPFKNFSVKIHPDLNKKEDFQRIITEGGGKIVTEKYTHYLTDKKEGVEKEYHTEEMIKYLIR